MSKQEMLWNLNNIVGRGKFDEFFNAAEKNIAKLGDYLKALSPGMPEESFRRMTAFTEKLKEDINRLSSYGSLWVSADINSQDARLYKSRAQDLMVSHTQALIPITQWLMGKPVEGLGRLDDANAQRLFKAVPDLEYVLSYQRLGAVHTLEQEVEKVMARKKVTGADPLTELYSLVSDGFEYRFKPKGKKEKVFKTQSRIRAYFYSSNPAERQAAYQALFKPYQDNISKFYVIYQALAKDWDQDARDRQFNSAVAMRNFYNQVPDQAIETLLRVSSDNVGIYQEYFKVKARLLGVKQLQRYDIYAPLERQKAKIPFDRAKTLVLETFKEFSPALAQNARQIFEAGHIDSHPRPGKESGAFCAMVAPKITPYILLNYSGDNSSVMTMAHELGHGAHDLYASAHSVSSAETTLPLAETASTTAEMLVFERLLSQAKSDKEKRAMLLEKIGDSYATVMRQAYFVKFEIAAHRLLLQGARESQLSGLYLKMLKEQFGSSVDVADEFRCEWAYIPHIFKTPFYCYAYNFGELLSMALFARYKHEGRSFVSKIEKILAYGGSQSPELILKQAGIDMSSASFWQGSYDVVRGWLEELKRLSK
ncbi:M3 family oligoendopeptidase [candidate division TA06 bacterium]|uniref:M3 family oligoendopeptidase n=1 Tax=candidate division TA06 bacterium TaxID=2250710 RepID=A0A933IBD3_UNCT6|nr:M3 family oligoendopeptidase [candidate division TA06 bacterium]